MTVSVRWAQIYESAGNEPFTFDYYRALHRQLFSELCDWAGELRTIDLSKKGTVFCPASDLLSVGNAMFERLSAMNEFRGLPRKQFAHEIAELYNDLNMLHPFREGNGRTQRLFFTLLIERTGYSIDFSAHDPDALILAIIHAAQGVMDHLYQFFDEAISPIK